MECHWATTKHVYVCCCCMWWCDGVCVRAALSLVESFDPADMHVVNIIFIISVSNSWMFTYHDNWNSHGKIVNSCFHGSLPCLLHDCLRTEFVITPPVRLRLYSAVSAKLGAFTDSINIGNYKFWMLIWVLLWEHERQEMRRVKIHKSAQCFYVYCDAFC